MSFSKYNEHKDSGVEWLGEVPAHWSIQKFRYLFQESGEKIDSDIVGDMLSVSGYRGVEPKIYEDENKRRTDAELFGYRIVRPGQLVVNTMWLNYSGLGVSDYKGHVSPAYRSYWIDGPINKRFVHHAMRSASYVKGYTKYLTGIRPNSLQMSRDDLMSFPVLIPSPYEQDAIASFLDHETARIDALVEEQQRLIELLKEKRQAVISHAVTKGLDPNVPMKDSGVDWLGEVPEHWDVVPTGYRYEVQLGRMLNETRASGENLKPYLRVFDVQWGGINTQDLPLMDFPPSAQKTYRLEAGDLMVNEGGSYVGRSAIWRGELSECYYQKALHRLRPRFQTADTADYFLYVMEMATQKGVFVANANQTTIDHLTAEQLRSHRFSFPTLDEQIAIARYLENATNRLERLTEEAQGLITLLQERRSALISAAVTGKIDVRGWQPLADSAVATGEVTQMEAV